LTALRNQDIEGFAAAAASDSAFVPMTEAALKLAREGLTSLAEAMRIAGGGES
jgi:type II secretory ATPase GspE/PulE/Tfp pilus assembly ATPase PilB-like protein